MHRSKPSPPKPKRAERRRQTQDLLRDQRREKEPLLFPQPDPLPLKPLG